MDCIHGWPWHEPITIPSVEPQFCCANRKSEEDTMTQLTKPSPSVKVGSREGGMARITKQEREIVKRMDEVRDLLFHFGLRLHGYDPGVSVLNSEGKYLHFEKLEWEWLEPILKQAKGWR